jgi:uncharacterized membrane protein
MRLFLWLKSRMLLPLTALSVVAMALYALWFTLIGPWNGPRLHLNLFLAWLPYVFATAAVAAHQNLPEQRWLFRLCFVLWLIFFPNAPYLITDWLYLPRWQDELWYGIILLTSFTVCGLLLAAVSLHLMQTVMSVRRGPDGGIATCAAALFLSGLGVYLGRFVRLNSWDLLLRPTDVWSDAVESIRSHGHHAGPVGFSVFFALLLGAVYYAIIDLRRTDWSREEYFVWNRRYRRPHAPRQPHDDVDEADERD